MKKSFMCCLILVFVFVAGFSGVASGQSLANITAINGTVYVLPSGGSSWNWAQVNMPLYSGDKVRTGSDGLAAIQYTDGSQIKVNTGTTLEIAVQGGEGGKSFVNLLIGEIWLLVNPSSNSYEVVTPSATAGVEGTTFDVNVTSDAECTLTVVEGSVNFSNSKGSVLVQKDMQSTALMGQAPSEVRRVDAGKFVQWTGDVSSLSTYTAVHIYYKDFQERKEAEKFLLENPDSPEALLTEGKMFFDDKEWEKAKEKFQAYLKVNPDSAEGHQALGYTLINLKEFDLAMAEMEQAAALETSSKYLLSRGLVCEYKNEMDKAREIYLEAIDKYPEEAPPYLYLADFYGSQGEFEEAEKKYKKSITSSR